MIDGGDFDVEVSVAGEYRWSYVTPGGAMYMGPRMHKTKAAALAAGKKWLKERLERG